jgi:hypothetical protein
VTKEVDALVESWYAMIQELKERKDEKGFSKINKTW